MDHTDSPKTYKLPILPASPTACVGGKEVTQGMIDSALAYNKNFRPGYVYANPAKAHGDSNREIAGSILRTSREQIDGREFIVAEVAPHRRYKAEGAFEELCAADGDYPGRSVDLWPKSMIPGCQTDYNLESIALCGANKPATMNLPPIYFATDTPTGVLTFAINIPTGDKTMPDEKEKQVDLATFNDLKLQVEQLAADNKKAADENKNLAAQLDLTVKENEKLAAAFAAEKTKSDRQEVEALLNGSDYAGKYTPEELPELIELALSLKGNTVELAASKKTPYQAVLDTIKNRKPLINLAVVGNHLPKTVNGSAQPASEIDAIKQFAADDKLDLGSLDGLTKATAGAKKRWPAVFGVKEENHG